MKWRGRHAVAIPMLMLLIVLLLVGCAPAFRAPPQFHARVERLKAVAMIPPNVTVYSLTAGGVKEEMDEWSAMARENLTRVFDMHFTKNTEFAFTPFKPETVLPPPRAETAWTDLDETKALYKAVSASIFLHTYHPQQTFPHKVSSFDYTLGPQVQGLAKQAKADALMFIDAVDHVSTGGRKALMAFGILMGAATGVYVVPTAGATAISAALVDGQTGDILWYNIQSSGGGYDLRDPESCAQLVQEVLKDFPGMQPATPKRS